MINPQTTCTVIIMYLSKRTAAAFITETYQLPTHSVMKEGIACEKVVGWVLLSTHGISQDAIRFSIRSLLPPHFGTRVGGLQRGQSVVAVAHGEQSTSN